MNTTLPPSTHATKPKTSIDILHERDGLAIELRDARATLEVVREETEHALRHPEIAFLSICRIAARLRRNAD